jgi:hypothetical protein
MNNDTTTTTDTDLLEVLSEISMLGLTALNLATTQDEEVQIAMMVSIACDLMVKNAL